jgi:Fe2+ or Zn2+ uptake regulation protein/Fe2+ transport system protein FeoA
MDIHPDELTQTSGDHGSRLTRHQLLVLAILRGIPGHPDAAKIYDEAKKQDDRISLATVYRALAALKAAGLVEEDRLGEGHGHFEAIQDVHHYHFTCLTCGKVIEFESPGLPEVVQELSGRENLVVTETYFHLRGFCPDCQKDQAQTFNRVAGMQDPAPQPVREGGQPAISGVPLSSLPGGKSGIVLGLEGGRELLARLAGLGFTPGTPVTVLQNHEGGPIIVTLLGAHLALGRGEARQIQVELQ